MQLQVGEPSSLDNSEIGVVPPQSQERNSSNGLPQAPRIEKLGSFEREPISEGTRQLLCLFATGDPTRPLPHVDADWEDVFQAICRNGLVALAYAHLKQQARGSYPPVEFRRRLSWAHLLASSYQARTRQHVKDILSRFDEAGIECLVLKGPALAEMIYPDPTVRWYGDLDVHVRDRDIPAAHTVLQDAGLILDDTDQTSPPKLLQQAPGDEWHYWTSDQWFQVELHGDDLMHAGLVPRDYEGLWQRAVTVNVLGIPVKALSLEDQLTTLSAHVHYHGYTRLNWLSDIAFLVRDHGHEVDWDRLIATVRREEVEVPVYYTLYFLEQMLAVKAPESVMRQIRPDRFRRIAHEHFLPAEKVISLDPMPRPDFSFYFLPLFQRLIPDLLVMGRRAEKLHYLARLLTPPSAWLRYYYDLEETDPIAHHYVLHPLKLAWHYLVSIGSAVSWTWRRTPAGEGHAGGRWWAANANTPGWQHAGHAH